MKTLQQFLPAEIRARIDAGEDLPIDDGQPLSSCTCRLPTGRWGKNGWHLRKTTPQEVGAAFKVYYLKQFQELAPRQQEQEWAEWFRLERERGRIDEDGIHRAWKAESGRTVYYERCPQTESRKQEEQQQLKLNVATTRGGKPRLD